LGDASASQALGMRPHACRVQLLAISCDSNTRPAYSCPALHALWQAPSPTSCATSRRPHARRSRLRRKCGQRQWDQASKQASSHWGACRLGVPRPASGHTQPEAATAGHTASLRHLAVALNSLPCRLPCALNVCRGPVGAGAG
jgi:hypothetical protein